MALIDRDTLLDKVHDFFCEGCPVTNIAVCNCCDYRGLMDKIKVIPTVNVKPVVHGEWTGWQKTAFHGIDDFGEPIYSDCITYEHKACGFGSIIRHNYCPRCGADMRGVMDG